MVKDLYAAGFTVDEVQGQGGSGSRLPIVRFLHGKLRQCERNREQLHPERIHSHTGTHQARRTGRQEDFMAKMSLLGI